MKNIKVTGKTHEQSIYQSRAHLMKIYCQGNAN